MKSLRECRFDTGVYYDAPTKDYDLDGENISLKNLLDWIQHQEQQFGMNAEKILQLLKEELE